MRIFAATAWLAFGAGALCAQPAPGEGLRWLDRVGIDGSPSGVVRNARLVCERRHPGRPDQQKTCENFTRMDAGSFFRASVPNEQAALACAVLATTGGATDWSEAWYCLTASRSAARSVAPQVLPDYPTGEITAKSVRCTTEPDSASEIVMTLSKGAPVSVVARQGDWLHLTRVTYRDCWAPAGAVLVHPKRAPDDVSTYDEAFYGTKN